MLQRIRSLLLLLVMLVLAQACATAPPRNPENICSIWNLAFLYRRDRWALARTTWLCWRNWFHSLVHAPGSEGQWHTARGRKQVISQLSRRARRLCPWYTQQKTVVDPRGDKCTVESWSLCRAICKLQSVFEARFFPSAHGVV